MKNPNKSLINPIHFPGPQNSFQYVSESPDPFKLLSRVISRARKWVYSNKRSQTYDIVRYSLRSVFASYASKNVSPKGVDLLLSGENGKEYMNSDPNIPTIPRMTIGRLFSKKVSSLKFPATFLISILEEPASTMSWDDQAFVKKTRYLMLWDA